MVGAGEINLWIVSQWMTSKGRYIESEEKSLETELGKLGKKKKKKKKQKRTIKRKLVHRKRNKNSS